MNQEIKEKLLELQQAELNGVLAYQKLAELIPGEEIKRKLLELAADEGRHAGILKKYTNEVLTPSDEGAKAIEAAYKQYGNKIFAQIAEGEDKGGDVYGAFVEFMPEAKSIIQDELKHARVARSILEA